MRDLIGRLTQRLNLQRNQVERTVALFDDSNTLPFIARYRKEVTGGLDEVQLADFQRELDALRKLASRQETVIKTIEEQGKLTPELADQIEEVETVQALEDIYQPYKPRRRTRAQAARERGLEPMAEWILGQYLYDGSLDEAAAEFISDEVPTVEDAWAGARDIAAEVVSDDARARDAVRRITWDRGRLISGSADTGKDPKRIYESYYSFNRKLGSLQPHQVLALNRGESEGVLKIEFDVITTGLIRVLERLYPTASDSPFAEQLDLAVHDGFNRLLFPAIQREVRRDLTAWADEHAINVFATNLRNLLLTPPLHNLTVLGIDPGFRTGCKVAVVDPTGKLLDVATIYPHPPQEARRVSLDTLHELVSAYSVDLIAIGNGTASRETEELSAKLIGEITHVRRSDIRYLIVSEAGASVYSASELARAEFPGLDVSLRGAVSIARRAQDPLAELVKIDPRSIGIGMYQHDVDQKALADALARTVESVVNTVGVNLNTASPALLQHVSGLGPKLAESIVMHRDQHGTFRSRRALKNVKGLGAKAFEQAAGFLRIPDGDSVLDNTAVHPESYKAVEGLARTFSLELAAPALPGDVLRIRKSMDLEKLSQQMGIGMLTLQDILAELQQPGRDPRTDVPAPILRSDVLKMEDLQPGMRLRGTVRNVVDFGAFVDIGVKQDGLIHISEMADHRIESPYDRVAVGDVVDVTIINIDTDRGRIGLSMR